MVNFNVHDHHHNKLVHDHKNIQQKSVSGLKKVIKGSEGTNVGMVQGIQVREKKTVKFHEIVIDLHQLPQATAQQTNKERKLSQKAIEPIRKNTGVVVGRRGERLSIHMHEQHIKKLRDLHKKLAEDKKRKISIVVRDERGSETVFESHKVDFSELTNEDHLLIEEAADSMFKQLHDHMNEDEHEIEDEDLKDTGEALLQDREEELIAREGIPRLRRARLSQNAQSQAKSRHDHHQQELESERIAQQARDSAKFRREIKLRRRHHEINREVRERHLETDIEYHRHKRSKKV